MPHDLDILVCLLHNSYFTVYPKGFQPYGRKPTIPLTPKGDEIGFPNIDSAWSSTCFRAVIDAANGVKWPMSFNKSQWMGEGDPPGVFRTQCRHILGANLLLIPEDNRDQEQVVASLSIGLADLIKASKIRDGPGVLWRVRGGGLNHLLRTLGVPRLSMLSPMNELGTKRGFWGPSQK